MKNCLLFCLILSGLAACKNESSTVDTVQTDNAAEQRDPSMPSLSCYQWVSGKDTAMLLFTIVDKSISGKLVYKYFEKDGAMGSFQGTMEGDVVTALYDYNIEGTQQIEEIVFKVSGDKVMRAKGELVDQAGKLVLKDRASASFDEVFNKINCPAGR